MSDPDSKWFNRLLWMLIAVVISLLGQVVVHYLTREHPAPAAPSPKPQLLFGLANPLPSEQDGKRVVTHSVLLLNNGTMEAEDVRLSITFPSGAKVIRAKIEPSEGPTVDYDVKKRPDMWLLTFPTLNPNESCLTTFILDAKTLEPLGVKLRGKGENGRRFPEPPTNLTVTPYGPEPPYMPFAAILVQVVLLAVLLPALLVAWFRRRRTKSKAAHLAGAAKN
jgi:hypothetical protein